MAFTRQAVCLATRVGARTVRQKPNYAVQLATKVTESYLEDKCKTFLSLSIDGKSSSEALARTLKTETKVAHNMFSSIGIDAFANNSNTSTFKLPTGGSSLFTDFKTTFRTDTR